MKIISKMYRQDMKNFTEHISKFGRFLQYLIKMNLVQTVLQTSTLKH